MFEVALGLEKIALNDEYFIARKSRNYVRTRSRQSHCYDGAINGLDRPRGQPAMPD
jgi:hypothetical protein